MEGRQQHPVCRLPERLIVVTRLEVRLARSLDARMEVAPDQVCVRRGDLLQTLDRLSPRSSSRLIVVSSDSMMLMRSRSGAFSGPRMVSGQSSGSIHLLLDLFLLLGGSQLAAQFSNLLRADALQQHARIAAASVRSTLTATAMPLATHVEGLDPASRNELRCSPSDTRRRT